MRGGRPLSGEHASPSAAASPRELVEALVREADEQLGGASAVPLTVPQRLADDLWLRAAWPAIEGQHAFEALDRLWRAWRKLREEQQHRDERARGERLLRRLDDAPRRLLLRHLERARREDPAGPGEMAMRRRVERRLGAPAEWLRPLARFTSNFLARLALIPTWQCQLRCRYCWIPKQDGRVMSIEVIQSAVEMLLSSARDAVNLQFFGGEALIEWGRVRHAIEYAQRRAREEGKSVDFVVSTNGWSLDEEKLSWLADKPVKLELSLDGDPDTQSRYRRARARDSDSYVHGIAPRASAIKATGLDHEVIMVVQPVTAPKLCDSFCHIADLGFERIQVNVALGVTWEKPDLEAFAAGLHRLGRELLRRRAAGERLMLVNLEHPAIPVRLNGEIHVDYDGTVFGSNGFLNAGAEREAFRIGHVDEMFGFDRYWMDAPSNDELLELTYPPEMTRNNRQTGRILASFVRAMQRELGLDPLAQSDEG